jgi:hypothetical protein
MKKKIFGIFVAALALAMFAIPVMAKTETPIQYYKWVENIESTEWRWVAPDRMGGESIIMMVTESIRTGSIYDGTDTSGEKLFTFTQNGFNMVNMKQGKQEWHFDVEWTSTTVDGGFKGRLNGEGIGGPQFRVQGVLQGFGEFKGQKLTIEEIRDPPPPPQPNGGQITGFRTVP